MKSCNFHQSDHIATAAPVLVDSYFQQMTHATSSRPTLCFPACSIAYSRWLIQRPECQQCIGATCSSTHSVTCVQQQRTDRCKYNSNDKERRQYCLWRQNWLPCLQALLFERGIFHQHRRSGMADTRYLLAGFLLFSTGLPSWSRAISSDNLQFNKAI